MLFGIECLDDVGVNSDENWYFCLSKLASPRRE